MPAEPDQRPRDGDPRPLDAAPPLAGPVEERLADKLSAPRPDGSAGHDRATAVLRRLGRYDRAVYRSVAGLSTPLLDEPLRWVSRFANHSKPWFVTAGLLALFGGPQGRRAALTGVAAIGATSLVVNQPMKMIGNRRRPDRDDLGVPEQRWVTHAHVDFVPVRSLRVRRSIRRCGRRSGAETQASAAWRRVGRGLLPGVHRRALPERRSGRRDRRCTPRAGGLDGGAPRRPGAARRGIHSSLCDVCAAAPQTDGSRRPKPSFMLCAGVATALAFDFTNGCHDERPTPWPPRSRPVR